MSLKWIADRRVVIFWKLLEIRKNVLSPAPLCEFGDLPKRSKFFHFWDSLIQGSRCIVKQTGSHKCCLPCNFFLNNNALSEISIIVCRGLGRSTEPYPMWIQCQSPIRTVVSWKIVMEKFRKCNDHRLHHTSNIERKNKQTLTCMQNKLTRWQQLFLEQTHQSE